MSPFLGGHRRQSPFPLLLALSLFLGATMLLSLPAGRSSAFETWWVQTHRETRLWSGPDAQAIPFGQLAQWSYLQVVAPQRGSRLYVLNPLTGGHAYVDATAVGPSAPPPAIALAVLTAGPPEPLRREPKLPAGFKGWWVSNFKETELWSGPGREATALGKVPQFRRFLAVEPQQGDRLKVWSPEKENFGYLDVSLVGPSGPSVWMEARQVKVVRGVGMPGRSVGDKAYVRNLPVHDDETELRHVPNNTPLQVRELVVAADGAEWYTVEGGGYIRAEEVRLPRPVAKPQPGRWIDADLSEPALVTAYEGDRIVYSAMAIKGFAATPTLRGSFQILRRVEDETMDSETIGIPRDSPDGYLLKNVLYTQYFTNDGASLHYNYWLGTFGYPGSHGCLGLNLEDARWFWDWAKVGTPIAIR
ncbi:MAG: L,D-transpeptidase [Chloroflexota bacterium]